MTNAVAENVNVEAEEPIDLLNGLDAEESAFVDGADPDAAELVDVESAGENAMEQAADAAAVVAEQAGAVESGDTPAQSGAEHTGPAVDPEVLSLRQQLDKLRSQLFQQQFSDREITEQSAKVRSLADDVRDLESQVKETKGELTAAKERHDSAVRELQGMIEDRGRGQRRLALGLPAVSSAATTGAETAGTSTDALTIPMETLAAATDAATEIATEPDPAKTDEHASSPISVLGQKEMIAQFGKDAWQAAKDREEPFGLAKSELEILETAEIATVGDIEKRMREDAWWHEKLPKMGEKKIAKLVETLRVWRTKFPMPA